MLAGLLLLGILSAVLGALAASLAGAALPVTVLAYSLGGNMGLLAAAAWRGRCVAEQKAADGRPRA